MRRGLPWVRLLLAGLVAAGACTDAPSGPESRETTRAPLAATRITVPARLGCSGNQAARSPFGVKAPSFNVVTADSLVEDSTAAYEPWDEPVVDYSAYYDPYSGEPCWDLYQSCITKCRRLKKAVDKAICWAACMDWYSGCLAERYLPPSLRPCTATVVQVTYDPEASDCDPSSNPGDGGGAGSGSGSNCQDEYVVIEISYDDGATWQTWWEGWATVCG